MHACGERKLMDMEKSAPEDTVQFAGVLPASTVSNWG